MVDCSRQHRKKNYKRIREIEKKSYIKGREKNPVRNLLHRCKSVVKYHGKEFNITIQDLFIPKICPLLQIPIFPNYGKRGPNSPSIDRIDSSKGYVKGNVWVVSWRANDLKRNGTLEEFKMLTNNLEKKLRSL